jgi:hypothetical protein
MPVDDECRYQLLRPGILNVGLVLILIHVLNSATRGTIAGLLRAFLNDSSGTTFSLIITSILIHSVSIPTKVGEVVNRSLPTTVPLLLVSDEAGDGLRDDGVEPGVAVCGHDDDGELPNKDQCNHAHEQGGHALLLALPRPQAAVCVPKRLLAGKRIVRLVWKGPGHVARVLEPAAAKGLLNAAYRVDILVAEERRPPLSQAAVEARRRSSVRAEQCHDDRRVDEDDRVRDHDERWAGRAAAGHAVAAILLASKDVASFEDEARNDWEQGGCVCEAITEGQREPLQTGRSIARHGCNDQEVLCGLSAVLLDGEVIRTMMLTQTTTCFLL